MTEENFFSVNDYVVYKCSGICRFEGVEAKCFDSRNTVNYYKFVPLNPPTASYYLPADKINEKISRIMTKEQLLKIIDSLPQYTPSFSQNGRERKNEFDSILKSDDYTDMLRMIHSIYESSVSSGKKMSAADEKIFKAAENRLYPEFAVILGIEAENVPQYIINRIKNA